MGAMKQIDREPVAKDATGNDALVRLTCQGAPREQIRDVVHEVLTDMVHRARSSRHTIPPQSGPRGARQSLSREAWQSLPPVRQPPSGEEREP